MLKCSMGGQKCKGIKWCGQEVCMWLVCVWCVCVCVCVGGWVGGRGGWG